MLSYNTSLQCKKYVGKDKHGILSQNGKFKTFSSIKRVLLWSSGSALDSE